MQTLFVFLLFVDMFGRIFGKTKKPEPIFKSPGHAPGRPGVLLEVVQMLFGKRVALSDAIGTLPDAENGWVVDEEEEEDEDEDEDESGSRSDLQAKGKEVIGMLENPATTPSDLLLLRKELELLEKENALLTVKEKAARLGVEV